MLNKFKNWIFDLDGTLINSSEEVLNCLKKAFKQADYYVDKSRFTSEVIGPPLKEIVQMIAPELSNEKKINEIVEYYSLEYDYDENDKSFMCDGMQNLLFNLQNLNKELFIATLKPKIPTMRLVKKFGLGMMKDIYSIDKFGYHMTKKEMISDIILKYDLDKNETVMVGDAAGDVLSAKQAGISSIGVLWGYGSDKTELIKNSDITIENVSEFYDKFKSYKT